MSKKQLFLVISVIVSVFLISPVADAFASGEKSAESAASTTGHGKYLAGQGVIIPPESVYVDSYIAGVDYRYPIPEEGIGISLYAGHRQVSGAGQEEIIQVGIQGRK
ncbi:MAG: hypothetical protein KAJ98_00225, partial [Spirochaetaceae bacterium]|nr:hypothetical protein [Spirochaetaceae bacterium]